MANVQGQKARAEFAHGALLHNERFQHLRPHVKTVMEVNSTSNPTDGAANEGGSDDPHGSPEEIR